MGLRLSKKHGVNPTIPLCFWCGERKNEVALMGALPGDAEAPRLLCMNYVPCDACKGKFDQGITLIEVRPDPIPNNPDQPAMSDGWYPTGRYLVVKEEIIPMIIMDKDIAEATMRVRKAFIPPELFNMLLNQKK